MTQEQLDRILKGQMAYWVIATFLATALALFAKLVWTAHFPILIMLPFILMGVALGSIAAIRKELSPLVTDEP